MSLGSKTEEKKGVFMRPDGESPYNRALEASTEPINVVNEDCIEGVDCLVICPTRGRVKMAGQMLVSFERTSSEKTGLIFCLDEDDPELEKYKEMIGTMAAYVVLKRTTITALFNRIFWKYSDKVRFFSPSNDDFIYITNHWDKKLMKAVEQEFSGWGLAYGNDLLQGQNLPSTSVISTKLVKALGWLQLPTLTHLYGDQVWNHIGQGLERISFQHKVLIEHRHFIGGKEKKDDVAERTNSQEMYQKDGKAFNTWLHKEARGMLDRVAREIHKDIYGGLVPRASDVSLCMIASDQEKPEVLERCLKSVEGWVDEVVIIFNYKRIPRFKQSRKEGDQEFPIRFRKAMDILGETRFRTRYMRWTDFSGMRNQSLELATGSYCMYLDCDDYVDNPWMIKDLIFRNPDVDAFRCKVFSYKQNKHKEVILHPRIFKNKNEYRFKNACHEDIMFALKEHNAKMMGCHLVVHHLGNVDPAAAKRKNLRNIQLLEKQMAEGDGHNLVYFGLVNAYLFTEDLEMIKKAIVLIDECFDKKLLAQDDPLAPKMWILRASACLTYYEKTKDTASFLGAKQGFQKVWGEWQHPEAGVCLAELLMIEHDFDRSIGILDELYALEEVVVPSVPFDMEEVLIKTLRLLGDCWLIKKDFDKAEKYYRECLQQRPDQIEVGDRLCAVLRMNKKMDEAALITMRLVNKYPRYYQGFANMAQYEMLSKRYITARMFLREALAIKPDHKTSRHNLDMINKTLRSRHQK